MSYFRQLMAEGCKYHKRPHRAVQPIRKVEFMGTLIDKSFLEGIRVDKKYLIFSAEIELCLKKAGMQHKVL